MAAQQQIGLARTQITSKQREQRLVRLTLSELGGLPEDAVTYQGVGKMWVHFPTDIDTWEVDLPPRLTPCRFALIALPTLRQKLELQSKDLDSDVDKLNKRLVYLETTHKNSREHIEQMLRTR